jgi:hypothetical protein
MIVERKERGRPVVYTPIIFFAKGRGRGLLAIIAYAVLPLQYIY